MTGFGQNLPGDAPVCSHELPSFSFLFFVSFVFPPGFSLQATTSSTPGASNVGTCRNASSAATNLPHSSSPQQSMHTQIHRSLWRNIGHGASISTARYGPSHAFSPYRSHSLQNSKAWMSCLNSNHLVGTKSIHWSLMLSPRKTCNWQQNESYNDNLSALEACDRYLESNKRQICRQSIVRTYHY